MSKIQIICEYHPKARLIHDWAAGDVICPECGLVVQDRVIDVCSEWRTFANDDNTKGDQSRVGAVENENVKNDSEKQANKVFNDILDRMNLPSVKDSAQAIFHKLHEANLVRGRSTDQLIAVCIYIACRQEGIPRTFKELEAVGRSQAVNIQRTYSAIKEALKEKGISISSMPAVSHSQYIARFASKLIPMKSMQIEKIATKVCDLAMNRSEFMGKRPDTIAATSVYIASLTIAPNVRINDVGKVSGVADSTIKSTYKMMVEKLGDSLKKI